MAEKPKWPSVEEQLDRHNIRRGSALEQLVRDNQDFHMLRPEEAHDRIDIPLWLRVYWRKTHPGSQHHPGDPTGGYPLVLDTVLAVMLANQDNPTGSKPPAGPAGPSGPPRPPQRKHAGGR